MTLLALNKEKPSITEHLINSTRKVNVVNQVSVN